MSTLPFDHQSVKAAGVSRRASKSTRRARARRSGKSRPLDPETKPASASFEQSVVAVLERISLLLVRHLHDVTIEKRLVLLASDARHALGLSFPDNELLILRGWPEDEKVGDALQALLTRLKELEPTSSTEEKDQEDSK